VSATEKTVEIFHNHELVAIHPKLHKVGSRSTWTSICLPRP